MNLLREAKSAYLRSAAQQPVDWMEWGGEAFAKARSEDKPVLLDVGAVWCHWCHVMDRESYEDAATAQLINHRFIAVKVDRDERPDVDTRYQAAVQSISGQGGWPLTAFLTPEGMPYFGGTYFPPEERYGRPSFGRVLLAMAEAWQSKREEVTETAASVLAAVEQSGSFGGRSEDLTLVLLQTILNGILQQFDSVNGGFGTQPKFPHAGALDLLLDAAARQHESSSLAERAGAAAMQTLKKLALGGIRDQLAGGFHRYSVDEKWIVPHFEKMSYDNAELLRTYAHAFASFVDPEFARVALETMRWMDEVLSDRERGGFFGSQDADASLEDDGDYYTWSLAEAREVLTSDEAKIAAPYFDIGDVGDMQHNPQKNVLHITKTLAAVARNAGIEIETARELLRSAERKLSVARQRRPAPYVDRTIYTGWNGLCISAYLAAGRTLSQPAAISFALKSLDRVLAGALDPDGLLRRVVTYGEAGEHDAVRSPAAMLDDYAFLAEACLDAFEASGDRRYFDHAERLAETLLTSFHDEAGGGFYDTPWTEGEARLGALNTPRKPLQDSPTPGGNAVAADVLLRLHALTGREELRQRAQATLQAFGGVVEHFGLYAAGYAKALRRLLCPPVQVCVVGNDKLADDLASTALARYLVNKSVVRLRREQLSALPLALAETLSSFADLEGSYAVVCAGLVCHPPVRNADALIDILVAV